MSMPYERGASEVFGYKTEGSSLAAIEARHSYHCPFLNSLCVKRSQHRDYDANIPAGACSVWHRSQFDAAPNPYIICPIRLTQDKQIFRDAQKLLGLNQAFPIKIVPELDLPLGRIDYTLVQVDPITTLIQDFVFLEIMTCSTTNTGDVLRSLHDILAGKLTQKRLAYGINFRQVISRMMVQVIAKAYACQKWNKQMVWAVQDVLYEYMRNTTKIQLYEVTPQVEHNRYPILFFVYEMANADTDQFQLRLKEIHGGAVEDVLSILEPIELPEVHGLVNLLQHRITNSSTTFDLQASPDAGLSKSADQVANDEGD